ncbi:unnamed protein product, partial [Amoebophrya sp. A25]
LGGELNEKAARVSANRRSTDEEALTQILGAEAGADTVANAGAALDWNEEATESVVRDVVREDDERKPPVATKEAEQDFQETEQARNVSATEDEPFSEDYGAGESFIRIHSGSGAQGEDADVDSSTQLPEAKKDSVAPTAQTEPQERQPQLLVNALQSEEITPAFPDSAQLAQAEEHDAYEAALLEEEHMAIAELEEAVEGEVSRLQEQATRAWVSASTYKRKLEHLEQGKPLPEELAQAREDLRATQDALAEAGERASEAEMEKKKLAETVRQLREERESIQDALQAARKISHKAGERLTKIFDKRGT